MIMVYLLGTLAGKGRALEMNSRGGGSNPPRSYLIKLSFQRLDIFSGILLVFFLFFIFYLKFHTSERTRNALISS